VRAAMPAKLKKAGATRTFGQTGQQVARSITARSASTIWHLIFLI
jgi:hypothetical protein